MKIELIRGRNICSLEEDFTIDLMAEPLVSAGLFAISGPTGSGKSSILDTICLALYNKTPRSVVGDDNKVNNDQITSKDPRNLLRRGAVEGFAEVQFIGVNGLRYRSRWSVRRARNKIQRDLQAVMLKLWLINEHDIEEELSGTSTETLSKIVSLTGLSFDQFTRAVMLAQNEFATFLKANENDKAALLEKLTGAEQFATISKTIFDRHSEAKNRLADVNNSVIGFPILTHEEVEETTHHITHETEQLKEATLHQATFQKEFDWLKRKEQFEIEEKSALFKQNSALAAYESAAPRREKATIIEESATGRGILKNLKVTEKEIAEHRDQLQIISKKIQQLGINKIALDEVYKLKNAGMVAAQVALTHAEPQLKKATELDVEIRTKTKADTQLTARVNLLKQEIARGQNEQTELQSQLNKQELNLTELKEWFVKHSTHETLIPDSALIAAELERWNQHRQEVIDVKAELDATQLMLVKINEADTQYEKEVRDLTEATNKIEQELTQVKTALSEFKKEATHQKLNLQRLQSTAITEASGVVRMLDSKSSEWRNKNQEKSDKEKELTQIEQEKPIVAEQLIVATSKLEAINEAYERAFLATSATVEELRESLQVGEACPVCGSKEHPRAHTGSNSHLHHVLQELKLTRNQHEAEVNELRAKENSLKQASLVLNQDIGIVTSSMDQLQNDIILNRNLLQEKIAPAKELLSETQELTLYSLQQLSDILVAQMRESEAIVKRIEVLENKERNYHTDLQRSNTQLSSLTNSRNENKQRLMIGEANRNTHKKKEIELDQLLGNLKEEITGRIGRFFTPEQWESDPKQFANSLRTLATNWRSKNATMNELEIAIQNLKQPLSLINQELAQSLATHEQQLQLLSDANGELNQLRKERIGYFNGEAPDKVRDMFNVTITLHNQQVEQSQRDVATCQQEISSLQGAITQLHETLQKQTDRVVADKDSFDTWLAAFNQDRSQPITATDLSTLYEVEESWLKGEKEQLKQLDTACIDLNATLAAAKGQLTTHLELPEAILDLGITVESISEKQKHANEQLEKLRDQLAHQRAKLTLHEENLKKRAGLQQDIEKLEVVVSNWAKLNEDFGSATGDKFRKLAMGFTLDNLLMHTNHHLEQIWNRYAISRKSDSLLLHVIDRNMCDELRPITTLSGGETFIVSLALALGLSSLASDRMHIETLFIDEGFGSLDSETLQMAMDALQQLHVQGRKVGVISHVQEMIEQIGVGIEVEKLGNGGSRIKIKG